MSIISMHEVTLNLAGNLLFDKVDWQISSCDRIALVGRNGAGKSSLLKLLQGELTIDSGQINKQSSLRIEGMTQDVPMGTNESVYHFLVKKLGEIGEVLDRFYRLSKDSRDGALEKLSVCHQKIDSLQAWDTVTHVEMMANRLGLDPGVEMSSLSGGMKRRVLLAAALIAKPDVLLLDEPTNHLDMQAIEWLESYLKNYSGSILVVTHDREFLNKVANKIVEIDRGKLNCFEGGYEAYLDRREAMRLSEQKHHKLFDKRLAEEEAWIRQGVKARRTRNEGRVRALEAMREQYKNRSAEIGRVKRFGVEVKRSGQQVIEASHIQYSLDNTSIIKDFSLSVARGAKIGIIGPNGCGKTTLIRLLLGELSPDSGEVKLGTSLNTGYFDQLRCQLEEDKTLMYNVADGAEYVTVSGKEKHVATYLREFLFPPERFNQSVSTLSGGERNRLLLAKLFAKPVNLLVMDEPTNDLDIETLELLEQMLLDYPGTLILISHDRAFINNIVTSVLVYENGRFNEYVGGYDDYKQQTKEKQASNIKSKAKKPLKATKLSFNEQRELACLPQKIESLEQKIAQAQTKLAEPDFYKQREEEVIVYRQQLEKDESELSSLYERWEALEAKAMA